MILKAALSLTWICQENVCDIPGLHSWATKFRTSTAAGHCWMNSSQNELSSNSWAITRHALNRKIIHLKCYKVCAEFKVGFKVVNSRVVGDFSWTLPKGSFSLIHKWIYWNICSVLQGHSWTKREQRGISAVPCCTPPEEGHRTHVHKARTHLVLISARSRTTAITGVEPSPVAGSEVWIERLPSWGSNMDWTACTTFSVMDSLWRGNAWWWGGTVKS